MDKKYAELLTRMPTHVDETCVYSLDELRFLLRKNGTSSHNMLKQPVVNALMHLINTTGLKPSVEAAEPKSGGASWARARPAPAARPASTGLLHRAPSRTASSAAAAPAAAAHGSGHRVAPRPAPISQRRGWRRPGRWPWRTRWARSRRSRTVGRAGRLFSGRAAAARSGAGSAPMVMCRAAVRRHLCYGENLR